MMSTNSRLQRLRRGLADKNVDAFFVSQPENRCYLSGFDGSAGYLLITQEKAVLATDFRYLEQADRQAPGYEVFRITNKIAEWFPKLIGDLNIRKLGFEAENITFALHQQMKDALDKQVKTGLVPLHSLVESLRTVKEPGEMERIKKAAAIGDAAYEHVKDIIKPGVTERQVAWEIEKCLREGGSQAVPFEIIVTAGPNAALPHARPSGRIIQAGEPIVIDMGARFDGYASDLTRTICLGKPDDKFKKVYGIVLEAQLAAISAIVEGMSGHEADNIARTVIGKAGYGETFGHGLGHGIGLATHEAPRLGPASADILTQGMVFTVEPGIYLPGWGGVRIEDLTTIKNGKLEVVSQAHKEKYD